MKKIALLISLIFVAFLNSCDIKINSNAGSAAGMIDDVLFIMEEDDWRNSLGDTVRYYFQKPYEVLPQYEPTFRINYIKPDHFTDLLQAVRNVIIVGAVKKDRTTRLALDIFGKENISYKNNVAVKKNMYAKGQQITYIYAKTEKDIATYLENNNSSIIKNIAANDNPKMYANLFYAGEEILLSKKLNEKHGINFKVPKGFRLAKETETFTWLRFDEPSFTTNLFFNHSNKKENKDFGIKSRNQFGKEYVIGNTKGSYMITENLVDVKQKTKTEGENEITVSKGLWKLTKDFLGGPFVNYLFFNQSKNKTVVIDGFINAPGEKKRQKMRQLEYLLQQTKF